ncbi:MAG: hypothetical protein MJY49_00520 [Bacteroidales bacterium]|nr:hypothetical protein [Bacteroidales bacterium]
MKKIIILLTAAIICIASNAQDNFKGDWSFQKSVLGTTIKRVLSFDSELSGNVEDNMSIVLSSGMMGVKLVGEMEISLTGTFDYKDGQLIINWDTESFLSEVVKPVECYYKGKPVPEMKTEMEKVMTEILDKVKEEALGEERYESATFKKGKLTLTERDEKGKTTSYTYYFVN